MELPEYKLKWLEEQLKLHNKLEQSFFKDYSYISAVALLRYFSCRPELCDDPQTNFLRQFAEEMKRTCLRYEKEDAVLFDAEPHDPQNFIDCIAWSMDLLRAYDKWNEEQGNTQ